jgi:hypothetical protein
LHQIQDSIGEILRPQFCVIRSLARTVPVAQCPFNLTDLRGEFVGLTRTFDQARQLVPQPEYPEDTFRQDQFHKRFGWRHIALSDGSLLKEVPSFGFDDKPITDCRRSDRDLFGETYTVFWLCPLDIEVAVSTLIDHVEQLIGSDSRTAALESLLERHHALGPYWQPCETIDCYLLLFVWRNYLDRMCLWGGDSSSHAYAEFLNVVRQRFVDHVSQLPNGPSRHDWDRLYKLLQM